MSTTDVFRKDLFNGKVAFVTGGSSGICKGMAEALVRHGAKLAIVSRSIDKLEKSAADIRQKVGGEIIVVAADVRKPDQIQGAVERAIEAFGRIDILVNGAAGNFLAPAETMSPNAFRTVIEIDLLGTFNTTKACLPYLKKSRGSIINVSATLHYTGTVFQSHVCAAKAAIDALTRSLATEWGPLGIRVNAVAPGGTEGTEGLARLLPPKNYEEYIRQCPMQRVGTIQDIEFATLYLASEAASFVTGQILVVDGGEYLHRMPMVPYPESVQNADNDVVKRLRVKL